MSGAGVGLEAVAAERGYLYLYALSCLRKRDLAEDAVQECLAAAMQALPRFEGRSSLRTWLVTILRSKIADLARRAAREISADALEPEESDAPWFTSRGGWEPAHVPAEWRDPEGVLSSEQFLAVLERCLEDLPPRTAQVFVLREVLGESIAVLCETLGITQNNCSVMLFRARMRLRECLEHHWFAAPA